MKVLSFIVTPNQSEARFTIRSLERQTLKTEIYSVIGVREGSRFAGEIVSKTVNSYLKHIDLEKYDFLLKSDNDVVYSPKFLEVNTKAGFDLMGAGASLLIRVKPFTEVCRGRFEENDIYDTELYKTFKRSQLKVLEWKCADLQPFIFRKMTFGFKRSLNTGRLVFELGTSLRRYAINCFLNGFRDNPYR